MSNTQHLTATIPGLFTGESLSAPAPSATDPVDTALSCHASEHDGPPSASPPTLLDPDETTPLPHTAPPPAVGHSLVTSRSRARALLTAQPPADRFRHSAWTVKREKVLACHLARALPEDRISRYVGCGANAWVMRSTDGHDRYKVVCDRCKDRWCDACAAERRRTICRNLRESLPSGRLRLLTLTLRSSDTPLAGQVDRIYHSFRRLRRSSTIKKYITGGISFLELTYNTERQQWHPHLHVICTGTFIPQNVVREAWHKITGDSWIVDVRMIRDSDHAANYVAKYASKAISPGIWTRDDIFLEAMTTLEGRKLFCTFGILSKLKLSSKPADDCGWQTVDTLKVLLLKAQRGDTDAIAILEHLEGDYEHGTPDLHVDDP